MVYWCRVFDMMPYHTAMGFRARSLLTSVALVLAHSPSAHAASQSDRETVLRRCAAEFGPAIDGTNGLFEVNRYYVLEARFDSRGRLTQLGVLPKHWFADTHPEWDEPDDVGGLTVVEYTSLVSRMESIRPKGGLLVRARRPVVAGTMATWRETYRRAIVLTSDVVDARRAEGAPREVKSFVVYFTAPSSISRSRSTTIPSRGFRAPISSPSSS
jgi:hypothetical protein